MRTVVALILFLLLPASSAFAAPPTVKLDKPVASVVTHQIPVSASVSDDVVRVEFRVRGELKFDDDTAPYGGTFDTTNVDDGPATISATAFSAGGESATATLDVLIDNTPPALTVTGPDRERFAPGSTQRWTFGASDAGAGFSHFRCSVVPMGAPPVFGACTGAAEHVLSGQPVGAYTFSVRAVDKVGNFLGKARDFKIEVPAAAATVSTAAPLAPVAPIVDPAIASAAAGEPVAAPQILVALGFGFTSTARATKVSNFVVKNVPAGARVTVLCPSGCAKKRFTKVVAVGGRLLLKPVLKKKLKVGTEITVIVSKPGFSSAVKVLTIRARKAPLVTTLCQPEGSSKPAAC
ncbi:Ig-like domain-containing protein [Solirubrobacter ginsenosidimutans]|uniref:Ig-like domain-containing protein n=1 Tax=Solirubrobacter ginsenosidimutans TaxID=490573 RepID=A0A9X3MQB8_9ACTN|nr:Ig-like domain-containing protein [Solirubrobacter ginsenosidimutans]MDA0160479.1 Ig-like domain-containing protein [Solirubrobacter ginsenosidimutans]